MGLARAYLGSLDKEMLYFLHKLMTMSSADLLDRWFESDVLKGTMAASGIIGTLVGPRTPGSAYVLLHHYFGEIDGVYRGGVLPKAAPGRSARQLQRLRGHLVPISARKRL